MTALATSFPSPAIHSQQQQIQHLFWRAGFGATNEQFSRKSIPEFVDDLFRDAQQINDLNVVDTTHLLDLLQRRKNGDKSVRKMLKKVFKTNKLHLNQAWVERMASGKAQLRERMTLFWHDHFACKHKNAFFVQQQNNTLRHYALGNFGDLLMSISKDAAMLSFLNNKQNRKRSPNENFARELLELFTLGIGHYTENDIKEAARAFTGWNFDQRGNFVLRKKQHDYGQKTFMGKTGNWNGDDIIAILLEQPQTARFIVEKIYKYFVNEQVNSKIIEQLARSFYECNYDISALMYQIFTAKWFYDVQHIGTKIKSPVELLVGLMRTFNIQLHNPKGLVLVQRLLSQELFNPPNVAGWKGGRAWIDSSTLSFRMNLANVIINNAENIAPPKADLSMEGSELSFKFPKARKLEASYDVSTFVQHFQQFRGKKSGELAKRLVAYLFQTDPNRFNINILPKQNNTASHQEIIQNWTLTLLSMPEYQLC